jgi:hypothetical protein
VQLLTELLAVQYLRCYHYLVQVGFEESPVFLVDMGFIESVEDFYYDLMKLDLLAFVSLLTKSEDCQTNVF